MIKKIAFTTPTFGYMEMVLVDPARNIFVADRTAKCGISYDNPDEMFPQEALDLFLMELPKELQEKITKVWIPSMDEIIGENCLPGFSNRNASRIRNGNATDKGQMWWTSTKGRAKFTHVLVDANGGLISDENDNRTAGFVPAIRVRNE